MKQLNAALFVLATATLFFASSCKKDSVPQVYFTASTATIDRGSSTTVNIELSSTTNNVIEVGFQLSGSNKAYFGSYTGVFFHDDSDKVETSVDAHGFIDSLGHMKITPGTKRVLITFKPLYDNFPHAAATFGIKMTSAENATIRSGSDTYTLNINQANADYLFASTLNYQGLEHEGIIHKKDSSYYDLFNVLQTVQVDTLVDTVYQKTGLFKMQSFSYIKNSNSNFDLTLNYTVDNGTFHTTKASNISATYLNLPAFQLGSNIVNCTNAQPTLAFNPPDTLGKTTPRMTTLTCDSLNSSDINLTVVNSPNPSPAYGNYFVINDGTMDLESIRYSFKGALTSKFIVYKK